MCSKGKPWKRMNHSCLYGVTSSGHCDIWKSKVGYKGMSNSLAPLMELAEAHSGIGKRKRKKITFLILLISEHTTQEAKK